MALLSAPAPSSTNAHDSPNAPESPNASESPNALESTSGPAPISALDLAELAAEIDRNGIDSIEPTVLDELTHYGLVCGMPPEVAAIIADNTAPRVARERAFGLLHRLAAS